MSPGRTCTPPQANSRLHLTVMMRRIIVRPRCRQPLASLQGAHRCRGNSRRDDPHGAHATMPGHCWTPKTHLAAAARIGDDDTPRLTTSPADVPTCGTTRRGHRRSLRWFRASIGRFDGCAARHRHAPPLLPQPQGARQDPSAQYQIADAVRRRRPHRNHGVPEPWQQRIGVNSAMIPPFGRPRQLTIARHHSPRRERCNARPVPGSITLHSAS